MRDKEENKNDYGGWVRKIEQNLESLDKRLDAVERRLSGDAIDLFPYDTKKHFRPSIVSDNEINQKFIEINKRIDAIEKKKLIGFGIDMIEITGLFGGIIAIIIAFLLYMGHKSVVLSPIFIAFAGIILLILIGLKTYFINKK